MYSYRYPRPALTVDIVIFSLINNRLHTLLIKRANDPYAHHWALPGGFVDISEGLEEAALRELKEETNISIAFLEQLYTFGDPQRDPRGRVISVAYYTLIPKRDSPDIQSGSDASEVKWFAVNSLPELAFDHRSIIGCAIERLKCKLLQTAIGFLLMPDRFTLQEMQRTYEFILEHKLERIDFRNRMIKSGIIEPVLKHRIEKRQRNRLYRFCNEAVIKLTLKTNCH
ncbi:MAG: NUDIX hydrolase [Chloroflexi bacterium]|nr:NUDIX hydrolase [Chloroflexota bacterium]